LSKAQDEVVVDSAIAKVEFENEQIRVLRLTYTAHQKSQMHSHPPRLLVTLTENNIRSVMVDGASSISSGCECIRVERTNHTCSGELGGRADGEH
jgi:hypothetical protein